MGIHLQRDVHPAGAVPQPGSGRYPAGSEALNAARLPAEGAKDAALLGLLLKADLLEGEGDAGVLWRPDVREAGGGRGKADEFLPRLLCVSAKVWRAA